MKITNLHPLSLSTVAQQLRNGELSAQTICEWVISNYQQFEPQFNAYRQWLPDSIYSAAERADQAFKKGQDFSPLQGLPISVKDCFGLAGTRTYCGTAGALAEKYEVEGPLIRQIIEQNAMITGKTHTDEFCYGGIGAVNHGQIPRNPWDNESHRLAGGSSSGAGVSLLQNTAFVALASDTSGSVRRPASVTATVGLKLTHGRWSTQGMVPLSPSLDTTGFLTRTAQDAAFVFSALEPGCDYQQFDVTKQGLSGKKLGVCPQHFWNDCSPGVEQGIRQALTELEAAGAKIVEIDFPEAEQAYHKGIDGGIVATEFSALLEHNLPNHFSQLHPFLGHRLTGTDKPQQLATHYLKSLMALKDLSHSAAEKLNSVDALISPTVPITIPKVNDVIQLDCYERANKLAVKNTYIPSLLQLCAISLPVALDNEGIPVGMQLMAPSMNEESLLNLSCLIEQTLGTAILRLGIAPMLVP